MSPFQLFFFKTNFFRMLASQQANLSFRERKKNRNFFMMARGFA
jgi:hypothetical protein